MQLVYQGLCTKNQTKRALTYPKLNELKVGRYRFIILSFSANTILVSIYFLYFIHNWEDIHI